MAARTAPPTSPGADPVPGNGLPPLHHQLTHPVAYLLPTGAAVCQSTTAALQSSSSMLAGPAPVLLLLPRPTPPNDHRWRPQYHKSAGFRLRRRNASSHSAILAPVIGHHGETCRNPGKSRLPSRYSLDRLCSLFCKLMLSMQQLLCGCML